MILGRVCVSVRSTVRGLNWGAGARTHKRMNGTTGRQVGGTSVCYLKTVGFLIFQGPHHLHGAVSSFAINPPQRSKPVEFSRKRWGSEKAGQKTTLKNDTFLLKNEAERGRGTLIWHRDPTPKGAGGNQVGTTGFAPCPAPSPAHKNHKKPVSLGAQGIAGKNVENSVENSNKCTIFVAKTTSFL